MRIVIRTLLSDRMKTPLVLTGIEWLSGKLTGPLVCRCQTVGKYIIGRERRLSRKNAGRPLNPRAPRCDRGHEVKVNYTKTRLLRAMDHCPTA